MPPPGYPIARPAAGARPRPRRPGPVVPPPGGVVPFGGPYGPPGPVVIDPHGLGMAAARLGSGARRAGKVALAVLATSLAEGEVVAVVIQGRFRGEPAVAALTGDRVVIANERAWKPDVVAVPVDPELVVQGWQDDRTAALTFVAGDRHEVVERIGDRGLAVELAQRIRHAPGRRRRAAGAAGSARSAGRAARTGRVTSPGGLVGRPAVLAMVLNPRGRGSVGRASPCQGEGRGFESRRPLHVTHGNPWPGQGFRALQPGFVSRPVQGADPRVRTGRRGRGAGRGRSGRSPRPVPSQKIAGSSNVQSWARAAVDPVEVEDAVDRRRAASLAPSMVARSVLVFT